MLREFFLQTRLILNKYLWKSMMLKENCIRKTYSTKGEEQGERGNEGVEEGRGRKEKGEEGGGRSMSKTKQVGGEAEKAEAGVSCFCK